MANEKVDVVIVGAGASGSVFAAVLAQAGKKVVVLEQGPDWKPSDLISSDLWGRRIKPASGPFLLEGKNPYGYVYNAGWGVGGAALHYFANFPRLLPNDFKMNSELGRALDWPISYSDVAPYYDKVAQDVGVWRPAGEPVHAADENLPPWRSMAQRLRRGRHPAGAQSVGMNSTDYGRPACIYDGWCHVGCPIGALANPQATYLGDARKAGAECARATVTRVMTNPQGEQGNGGRVLR
jgi:choline dehydrogenase-like flavoprotein